MNFKKNDEILEKFFDLISRMQGPERNFMLEIYQELKAERFNEELIQNNLIKINEIDNEIEEIDGMSEVLEDRRAYLKNELIKLYEDIN